MKDIDALDEHESLFGRDDDKLYKQIKRNIGSCMMKVKGKAFHDKYNKFHSFRKTFRNRMLH